MHHTVLFVVLHLNADFIMRKKIICHSYSDDNYFGVKSLIIWQNSKKLGQSFFFIIIFLIII